MRWPWQKREAEPDYTQQIMDQQLEAAASGTRKALAGHVMAASSVWAEVLALCEVQASDSGTRRTEPVPGRGAGPRDGHRRVQPFDKSACPVIAWACPTTARAAACTRRRLVMHCW